VDYDEHVIPVAEAVAVKLCLTKSSFGNPDFGLRWWKSLESGCQLRNRLDYFCLQGFHSPSDTGPSNVCSSPTGYGSVNSSPSLLILWNITNRAVNLLAEAVSRKACLHKVQLGI